VKKVRDLTRRDSNHLNIQLSEIKHHNILDSQAVLVPWAVNATASAVSFWATSKLYKSVRVSSNCVRVSFKSDSRLPIIIRWLFQIHSVRLQHAQQNACVMLEHELTSPPAPS
jgi:hypothetical protein